MPFENGKKRVFFFFFRESHGFASARGTVVLSRESRPCLSEREKQNAFSVFFSFASHGFASASGTVVLSRESQPCLLENEKKNVFSLFSFREWHGYDFVRGMGVFLSKRKKTCAPGSVFSSGFFCEKSSSKPINIGSSFEDLDARNPTVKVVRDLDARFER